MCKSLLTRLISALQSTETRIKPISTPVSKTNETVVGEVTDPKILRLISFARELAEEYEQASKKEKVTDDVDGYDQARIVIMKRKMDAVMTLAWAAIKEDLIKSPEVHKRIIAKKGEIALRQGWKIVVTSG